MSESDVRRGLPLLDEASFDRLVSRFRGAKSHVGDGPVASRAARLLAWFDSPAGPPFSSLVEAYSDITGRSYVSERTDTASSATLIADSSTAKFADSPRESLAVREVVLLIHGIRTQAPWQRTVKRVIEEIPGVFVQESSYGYFDVFRFWCPFFTRTQSIREVRETIQELKRRYRDAKLSVIAHSNGTYIITRLLQSERDLELNRLVLCGSIVRRQYRWPESQLATDVVNDYGTRDIWPVLAKALSWGYGDTGRHRFGKPGVRDRGHDYAHSDYFEDEAGNCENFVRKYWKPWFKSGQWVDSPHTRSSPIWLSWLSVLPLQWAIIAVVMLRLASLIVAPEGPPKDETPREWTYAVVDAATDDPIYREYSVHFRHKGESQERTAFSRSRGEFAVGAGPNLIEIYDIKTPGFRFDSRRSQERLFDRRLALERIEFEIPQPGEPPNTFLYSVKPDMEAVPKPSFQQYRAAIEDQDSTRRASFTLVNKSQAGVTPIVFPWFHPDAQRTPADGFDFVQLPTCKSHDTKPYDWDFKESGAYFLVFLSIYGQRAQFLPSAGGNLQGKNKKLLYVQRIDVTDPTRPKIIAGSGTD